MSLNINTTAYSLYGIDTAQVAKVSGEILNSANKEPQVANIDYSKFNRASLGVDLYSKRTAPELQKQISLIQAGLYTNAVNVAKLNAAAAANLYSATTVQKNVELAQSVSSNEISTQTNIEELDNKIGIFNITDKNQNSSNGFNPFANKETEKHESEIESLAG